MKILFFLFISLSLAVCLPIDLLSEESHLAPSSKELPHVELSVLHNDVSVIFPQPVLVVAKVDSVITEPTKTNESFTGPPLSVIVQRKLLSVDTDTDSEEEDEGGVGAEPPEDSEEEESDSEEEESEDGDVGGVGLEPPEVGGVGAEPPEEGGVGGVGAEPPEEGGVG